MKPLAAEEFAALEARVAELERRFAEQDAAAEADARRASREQHRAWVAANRGVHPLDFVGHEDDVLRWGAEVDRAVSRPRRAA